MKVDFDLKKLMENLSERGFEPYFAVDSATAVEKSLELIPTFASIGFGGSTTVQQIHLPEKLIARGNRIFHRAFPSDLTAEQIMRVSFSADWYVCSANALLQSGEIFNVDGTANRVSATLYGAKNVLFIVGTNKIVQNLDMAQQRLHDVAAPLNLKRLGKYAPCIDSKPCSVCSKEQTICKAKVILSHPTTSKRVVVIIVDESLGF